jgi:hypothetical protein
MLVTTLRSATSRVRTLAGSTRGARIFERD